MKQRNFFTVSSLSKIAKSIVSVLLLATVLTSCTEDEDINEPIEAADVAPQFTLKSSDGADVSLSSFKNKVVVLFFFGNNCPSCKAVAPNVQSMLVDAFASKTDFMVLGLDQWNGNAASVEAFKTATGVKFPLLLNASGVAADYKTTYDRIVVIDKTGKIVFSGKQLVSQDLAAAITTVTGLLPN